MHDSDAFYQLDWHHSTFYLLPERAIYWPDQSALLLADVHLGKVGHFRKHGIAVPNQVVQQDLARIQALIAHFAPSKLIFMGDLFHSRYNHEWDVFAEEMEEFSGEKILIEGNHDRHVRGREQALGLQLIPELILDNLVLTHEPPIDPDSGKAYLCGHIHPGVYMRGGGRQKLRLPCFFQQPQTLILPAFGRFTGLYAMSPNADDKVFVVADGRVIAV